MQDSNFAITKDILKGLELNNVNDIFRKEKTIKKIANRSQSFRITLIFTILASNYYCVHYISSIFYTFKDALFDTTKSILYLKLVNSRLLFRRMKLSIQRISYTYSRL